MLSWQQYPHPHDRKVQSWQLHRSRITQRTLESVGRAGDRDCRVLSWQQHPHPHDRKVQSWQLHRSRVTPKVLSWQQHLGHELNQLRVLLREEAELYGVSILPS